MTDQHSRQESSPRQRSSLRRKFAETMLIVSAIIGGTTLAIVLVLSARASTRHLREIEASIEESIISKGKVLAENHALALRGMVLDNAFLDMQTLVARAVREDPDLVYGLFVNADGAVLALGRRGDSDEATPRKDAWKTLGLRQEDLAARQESVQRLWRLDQEVVEVIDPVVGEDGEVLGSVRYGLSTRRMHQAIAAAAADSKTQQLRSVELIGTTVGLATALGILLSRVQAVRITRPVQALTRAASDLAAGNRTVRVAIDSGDELQTLGFSFNRMVEDLSSSYDALESLNRTLEQKVEARTLELAGRNRAMRLVLDNVDQGFLTLSLDGEMASERSAVIDQWFGECGAPGTFWAYLGRSSPAFAAEFEVAWDQVVSDFLPTDVAIAQLPSRLTASCSTFSFRYLPIHREQRLEGALVVIADITDKLQREREEAELLELTQGLRRVMLDRAGFAAFLNEATDTVDKICRHHDQVAPSALTAMLHTLKGNAGQMGLTVVAKICHLLEDETVNRGEMSAESLSELSSHWHTLINQILPLAGLVERNAIEVPDRDYLALVSLLSSEPESEALRLVLSWRLEPASRALGRLAEQAKALAARLGKGEIIVDIEPTTVQLDPEKFGALFSDLGHVVRNAVDHGLEDVEQRVAEGKPPHGRLTLGAAVVGDSLIFEITDDGAGIDWETIRKHGSELDLPGRTPAELLAILCHQGITTRTEVTQTSGRGVGMSAVKQRVEAMCGKLEVQSSLGRGTTWKIVLPWAQERTTESVRLRQSRLAALGPADNKNGRPLTPA